MKTKYWHHKKYKRAFLGTYERDSAGERIFVLTGYGAKLALKRIVFESVQAAKALGWVKK